MELTLIPSDAFENNDLVAVYCNQQATDRFLVGRMVMLGNDALLLCLISPDMEFDGLCLCMSHSIFRIEQNSQYLKRMNKLFIPYVTEHFAEQPWDYFLRIAEKGNMTIHILDRFGKKVVGVPIKHTMGTVNIRCKHSNGPLTYVMQMKRHDVSLMEINPDSKWNAQILKGKGVLENA